MAEELAARTKLERTKQDEVRTGSSKRKSAATATTAAINPPVQKGVTPRNRKSSKSAQSNISPPSTTPQKSGINRKEKVYCICRSVPNPKPISHSHYVSFLR